MFNANFHYESLIRPNAAWRSPRLILHRVPARLRGAMKVKGSLTKYIEAQSGDTMHVRVLSEAWEKPLEYERHALGLRISDRVWVRQVMLSASGVQWVYARSVVPQYALQGHWKQLMQLRQKPLGSVLFKRLKSDRGVIRIGHVPLPSTALISEHLQSLESGRVWARYSVFTQRDSAASASNRRPKRMLVSEYFLSSFNAHADVHEVEASNAH